MRAALGATPETLRRSVLVQATRMSAARLGLGLGLAFFGARLLSSVLVDGAGSLLSNAAISPRLMGLVLFVVAWWQGSAAARVELNRTLREE